MPKKSVREMNKIERKHNSLEARIFHATLLGSIVLGLVAMLVGLGLYVYALTGQHITEAFQLSRNTATVLEHIVDVKPMAEQTMKLYRNQTEEDRSQPFTSDYRSRFEKITALPEYQKTMDVINIFLKDSNVYDIYLAMYDEETSAIVYIVDPDDDPNSVCMPGDWESVNSEKMKRFLSWNGEGQLYDLDNTEKYGWICTAGVPIKDEQGKPVAFMLSDITMQNIVVRTRSFFFQFLIAMVVVTCLWTWLLIHKLKKNMVQPINAIAQAAQDYIKDKRTGVRDTEHFADLNIHTGDEIENLSLIMSEMEHDLHDYIENLTKATAEKERVKTELTMATQIQEGMLPNIYPAFPDREEFDIYASMDPARAVGGDFYDYFLVDNNHLCVVMADVSGKGIPAALFMMASKIILKNNAMMGKSPAQVLTDTNTMICSNNSMEMFVTVWLGILEISTGKLTAANAGHEYPMLKDPNGKFELYKDKHDFVIGGMDGIKYKEYEIMLKPGSKLFLYTDGVPEATNKDNEMFTTKRMLTALNDNPDDDPIDILQTVRRTVNSFVKNAEQFDDLTMLCLKYKEKRDE